MTKGELLNLLKDVPDNAELNVTAFGLDESKSYFKVKDISLSYDDSKNMSTSKKNCKILNIDLFSKEIHRKL